ncbi:hypothetical protein [Thermococcus sp. P6]|uniref:hypothetical protein n=1 Tax=Thermococcus sp. P6 TaxID=122420 RepID=UPI001E35C5EE|nr:hypothetical protein [Thermococcus sp. P6]
MEGYWLYGEYDFIARLEFRDEFEMEDFSRELRRTINGGTFKLIPILVSGVKNGKETSVLEGVKLSAP